MHLEIQVFSKEDGSYKKSAEQSLEFSVPDDLTEIIDAKRVGEQCGLLVKDVIDQYRAIRQARLKREKEAEQEPA